MIAPVSQGDHVLFQSAAYCKIFLISCLLHFI